MGMPSTVKEITPLVNSSETECIKDQVKSRTPASPRCKLNEEASHSGADAPPNSYDGVGTSNKMKRAELNNTRYFIIKSLNHQNIQLSINQGIWATQVMYEPILEEAFILHLRRVGVEAKPDEVQKDVPGRSSSNDQNDGTHADDAPEDDRSGPEDASGPPPASEDPYSGNLDNQSFSNTQISNVSIECFKLALAPEVLSRLSCECIVHNLLNLHLGTLYFNQKCSKEV